MIQATASTDNARSLTIAQLVMSIIGLTLLAVTLIGVSILLLVAPAAQEFSNEQTNQLRGILWIILAAILLTIPSLITAIRRLTGQPVRSLPRGLFLVASITLVLIAPVVLLGNHLSKTAGGHWLFGLLNVFIIFIPLWWFLELGRLRLNRGSAQRQWGVTAFSFFITLPVVIVVEMIILGIGLLIGAVWLVQQPEFAPMLQQLEQVFSSGALDPQDLAFDWLPLLQKPGVIVAFILGAALVVPLIEELLKPLGVWALIRRELTPAGGFTAGMICGAAFALLESLFSLSAVSGGEWLYTVAGRAGTGLLHLTLTGFNGWALAASWKDGGFSRVGFTYFITVLVHGAWNLFAMLMGLNMLGGELPVNVNPALSASAPWVLGALAIGMLAALLIMNLRLRRATNVHARTLPPPLPVTPGGME